MELLQDPRCYTDLCIQGKWFHYDHCGTQVYMLGGGDRTWQLDKEPKTEPELEQLLNHLIEEVI